MRRFIPRPHHRQIAVDIAGDGPPIMLEGGIDGPELYETDAEFRDAGFKTHVVHQRGTGASSHPHGMWTIHADVQDLLAVMDALHIRRAFLLGHSKGGGVMKAFAAAHPDRVIALATLSGTPGFPGFMEVDWRLVIKEFWIHRIAPHLFHHHGVAEHQHHRVLPPRLNEGRIDYLRQAVIAMLYLGFLNERRVHAPFQVIAGGEDYLVTVTQGRQVQARAPGARGRPLEVIPGADHSGMTNAHSVDSVRLAGDFFWHVLGQQGPRRGGLGVAL